MSSQSCLIAQFDRIVSLTERERELLSSLEKDARNYPAKTVLVAQAKKTENFFSLRSGWACASHLQADGSRQIIDIFTAGQIMGLREVGFLRAHATIETLTDVVACPFPRDRLSEIFDESSRLAVIFFLILAQSHAILTQRLSNIGNNSATANLAHFILEIWSCLNIEETTFEFPLNQSIIGDVLGVTSVHVSRVMNDLKHRGLIKQNGTRLTIVDLNSLAEVGEFSADYMNVRADLLLP